MDAMQLANSLPMWLACGTAVLLVVFQAVIFTKKAMGPPTDTRSESIPLRITTDGPREVRAELFIARFT